MAHNIVHSHTYDSVTEFVDYVQNAPLSWDPSVCSTVNRTAGQSWCGGVSLEGAIKLAQNGWSEGRDKLSRELDGMRADAKIGAAPAIVYDVAGYLPHVPRAVAGDPACMMNFGNVEIKNKPIIRMLINTTTSSNTNPENIIFRGAALLSYIDGLEEAGYSVELTGYELTLGRGNKAVNLEVTFKRAGAPLELDRLAYVLLHPSYLRRLCLRWEETLSNTQRDFSPCYGSPLNKREWREEGYTMHFPSLEYYQCGSRKSAIEYVKKIIDAAMNPPAEGEGQGGL